MKEKCIILILFIFLLLFTHVPSSFGTQMKEIDLNRIIEELNSQQSTLNNILKTKYSNIPDNSFKKQVCKSQYYNCFTNNTYKYFLQYNNFFNQQGSFYFGLLYNEQLKLLLASLAQCESGFIPNKISPDEGYGLFQVTPSASGINIKNKSSLLDPNININYGLKILNNFYKESFKYYDKKYDIIYHIDYRQQLVLRGYNGGFLYLSRTINKSQNIQSYPEIQTTGQYIEPSIKNGRFICFERVNVIYPIKIYLTYKYLNKRKEIH